MKYFIKIEGGFTGIPEIYEGEITADTGITSHLMQLLQKPIPPGNPDLRDGVNYRIALRDKEHEASGVYSDTQLPTELRQFLDRIRFGDLLE